MIVETILATKGTDVTTIEPTATLEFGIGILAERGIGALVVLGADHRVIGLLSELVSCGRLPSEAQAC
jgi:CBS domain-containing protein